MITLNPNIEAKIKENDFFGGIIPSGAGHRTLLEPIRSCDS